MKEERLCEPAASQISPQAPRPVTWRLRPSTIRLDHTVDVHVLSSQYILQPNFVCGVPCMQSTCVWLSVCVHYKYMHTHAHCQMFFVLNVDQR